MIVVWYSVIVFIHISDYSDERKYAVPNFYVTKCIAIIHCPSFLTSSNKLRNNCYQLEKNLH